ncbi:MAG: acetate kinase, partial [Armatimonadetes bacterium]|nr:acetate kinase [Armatimonadota bacterium]
MIVLVINCGSSSLKYELFDMAREQSLAEGICERVAVNGGADAQLRQTTADGRQVHHSMPMPDHAAAFSAMVTALTDPRDGVIAALSEIDAVGHRVVHGGENFAESVVINEEVLAVIDRCSALAPLHNPANLEGIRAAQQHLPNVTHV